MKIIDPLRKARIGSIIIIELVNRLKAKKDADNVIHTQCDNDFIKRESAGWCSFCDNYRWYMNNRLEGFPSGNLNWIDEAIKAEEEYWTCETRYGNELIQRMCGWEDKSKHENVQLKKEILTFIRNKSNQVHDRFIVEQLSYGFFKFADIY